MRIVTFIVLLAASAFTALAQQTSQPDPVAIKPGQALADDTTNQSADGGPSTATLVGTLGVTISCDLENHRSSTEYSLQTDDETIHPLRFSTPRRLTSGARVSVTGIQAPEGFQVDTLTELEKVHARGAPQENIGDQSTILLLVNSFENPVQPITPTEAYDRVFSLSRTDSIHSWIKQVSYERTSLSGDVSGWHTLSLTRVQLCHGQNAFWNQAIFNELDSFVNFSLYERVVMVIPFDSGCQWSGIGSVGKEQYTNDGGVLLSVQRLNGAGELNDGTGVHELGHNFGAYHANAWDCGANILEGSCNSLEYFDPFDVLGASFPKGYFNAVHREKIGWFEANEILQLTNESGAYVLGPLETPNVLKAIKIPSNGFMFYVEYRRAIGYDNNYVYNNLGWGMLGTDVYRGAIIHTDQFFGTGDSQLLDMLPHLLLPTNSVANQLDIVESMLEVGTTFSYNGVNLTPTRLNDASLNVCVEFGDHLDADSDGVPDACDVCPGFNDAEPCPIPAISAWGMVAMAALMLAAGAVVVSRRRAAG